MIGVSTDSVKSHENFKAKNDLLFTLVADPEKEIVTKYGVYVEKKNYGRSYMGVERTTFIIDEEGKIAQTFNKVRVNGHVDAVVGAL